MKKYYEKELPEGYVVAKVIDATNKKIVLIMNVAAILITIGIISIAYILIQPYHFFEELQQFILSTKYWIFVFLLIFYIIVHELLHGIAYKILTKQKLKFGLTLSVAYCGVPNIYTYRKTSLIALLTPFLFFNIVYIIAFFLLQSKIDLLLCAILFGIHIGGCIGDLYDSYLFLFKYTSHLTLMNDNGPTQIIYVPSSIHKNS